VGRLDRSRGSLTISAARRKEWGQDGVAVRTAVPLVDLGSTEPELRRALRCAFERVLASGRFVAGEEVARFEAALAGRIGVGSGVGVGSGTAALALALKAAGIGPGDEVILPANTFFATLEAVVAAGATPVLSDVDIATGSIEPASVEAAITPRTAAVIGVHLYGLPCDVDRLTAVAAKHALFLLEDAAQAMGAGWHGRPVGSLGHAAAFSFFPTKNLGALGEAGAITTNDEALARRARVLRSHGETAKNVHEQIASNERLDELQAAFLIAKLQVFDRELAARRVLARRYRARLGAIEGVTLFDEPEPTEPAYHLLVTRVANRDFVLDSLRAQGVEAAVHYPTPVHLQPACRFLGLGEGSLPGAEALSRTVLSLPFFPSLTSEQMDVAVEALRTTIGSR
jgi:dTDP-4-amino-4,6-dideoxygalactose transaminase